ncbi:hypothetical protein [Ulvibacterium sp.]|nr:hypothetical protein [Ulvibacterium sp.]
MRNKLECMLPDYDYHLEKKSYKTILFIKDWLTSATIDGASEMCKTK